MGKLGFKVTPHAYGIPTSLQAEYGEGGRLVVFNAEYDALPGIGHACGHNLIATASLAGFIATVAALKTSGKPGRVRLLGTPAEEGGCGKGMLVGKGAYDGVAACVTAHPAPMFAYGTEGRHGDAFVNHVATTSFKIQFEGKAAHAAASPWEGVNALDAAVLGYNGVSMMRQQMTKDSTVHGIFTDAGIKSNVIPDFAAVEYAVRAPTIEKTLELRDRVVANFRAGAVGTGCKMQVEYDVFYAPMRPNKQLSLVFADCAADLGFPCGATWTRRRLSLALPTRGTSVVLSPSSTPSTVSRPRKGRATTLLASQKLLEPSQRTSALSLLPRLWRDLPGLS